MGSSKIPGGNGEVKLNRKGMRQLLKSEEVLDELTDRMRRVQAAIPGSELRAGRSPTRARVRVAYGSDYEEANTGRLVRALDNARGQRGFKVKTRKPKAR